MISEHSWKVALEAAAEFHARKLFFAPNPRARGIGPSDEPGLGAGKTDEFLELIRKRGIGAADGGC